MRALHAIAALAMFGAVAPSVRLAGDPMFTARLRPRRYPSGRFYRPQVGGHVSRQQRRAREFARCIAKLTAALPNLPRRRRRSGGRAGAKLVARNARSGRA